MRFACSRRIRTAAPTTVLLLLLSLSVSNASTITTAPKVTSTSTSTTITNSICEFRTINYITDSLPQQCLKSSWSSGANATASTSTVAEIQGQGGNKTAVMDEGVVEGSTMVHGSGDAGQQGMQRSVEKEAAVSSEAASSTAELPATSTDVTDEVATDLESGELNDASFLSFEEWKKQTLEKAGQANANIWNKKSGGRRDSEAIQNHLDSLGDEGEIELDFGAFRSGGNGEESSQYSKTNEPDAQASQEAKDEGKKHRSTDAGITCKERFSYASFDAGATILKTHQGAKNSKAVLIENKDSYMLSECATENKFLIVELSEDIWIDTVVLANYEFFSSMIRTFRVSVSDRYPVKMEKWKDIGVYEARNSREIQAFLIENPQIWARYLRIEFLSHYGNEYYCPLSLLRVHGQRMLESWKETEASGDEDDVEEVGGQREGEHYEPDAVAEVVQEEERLNAELKEAQAAMDDLVKTAASTSDQVEPALTSSHLTDVQQSLEDATAEQMMTPWAKPEVEIFCPIKEDMDICLPSDAPNERPSETTAGLEFEVVLNADKITATAQPSAGGVVSPPPTPIATSQSDGAVSEAIPSEMSSPSAASNLTSIASSIKDSITSPIASVANKTSSAASSPPAISKSQNTTITQKNKTTSTSSASSSLPTIQESFFKAVSRRLQLLETNSPLSLKYIEEQSKILREAFTKVEKKQLQKTTTFLETLNSTVLAELRSFRQQYDEIWQSTVISLESQRDESRREILAISTRLNILADEVVFQKRMSIVQSLLLLLCLGLVIFSRVSGGGQIDFSAAMQARARSPLSPLGSPPFSPDFRRTGSMRDADTWLRPDGRRQDGSPIRRSRNTEDDDSPPTPASFYSRSENAFTPPLGADDMANLMHEHSTPRPRTHHEDTDFTSSSTPPHEPPDPQPSDSSPTVQTPLKRKISRRHQSSPLANDGSPEHPLTTSLEPSTPITYATSEPAPTADLLPPLPSPLTDPEGGGGGGEAELQYYKEAVACFAS